MHMTEEETRNNNDEKTAGSDEQTNQSAAGTDELFEEVQRLGARFASVIQTAWNSEERKSLEADLKRGLDSVTASLEEGFQKAGESRKTQDLVDKADDVMTKTGEKVRSSEVASELSVSLAKGLRKVSDQLEKWVEEQEGGASASQSPDDPADEQEIPIDKG
jgi:hypothetical protein